ncbi:hypothetical protein CRUP_026358 [Coryphaenoides rupestris]|nr:hypothetical protein CRUP_026358 [Coryphaenoides rupestris]
MLLQSCVILILLLLSAGGSTALPSPPSSYSDCKTYNERPRTAGKASPLLAPPPPSTGNSSTITTTTITLEDKKVVCSNTELRQVLPPDALPNRTVTLDLRSNLISRIEPGAFLGLPALKRL